MKSCREIREQFLETPVPAEVKEHVAACSECEQAWAGFQKTMALLDEWRAPEPSPFFDTRFRARFKELKEQEAMRSQGWFAWLRGPVWRPAMAGALAVVMAIGVTVLYRRSDDGTIAKQKSPIAVKGTAVADLKSIDQNEDLI